MPWRGNDSERSRPRLRSRRAICARMSRRAARSSTIWSRTRVPAEVMATLTEKPPADGIARTSPRGHYFGGGPEGLRDRHLRDRPDLDRDDRGSARPLADRRALSGLAEEPRDRAEL